jgi:hypothetical protein
MSEGIVNPIPRLEATLRSQSGVRIVGPTDTWEIGSLIDNLGVHAPTDAGSVLPSDIEIRGMFFGSAPGLSLPPSRVRDLARARTSLVIALRTTDFGVIGRDTPVAARDADRTILSVSFRVKGLFEPDDFSRRVGLVPTKISRRQQPRRLMARVSTWRLEVGPQAGGAFAPSATEHLLSQLEPHTDSIRSAVRETGTRSAFTFAAVYGDIVPSLSVSADVMTRIAELESWLDFSLMVVREDRDILEF